MIRAIVRGPPDYSTIVIHFKPHSIIFRPLFYRRLPLLNCQCLVTISMYLHGTMSTGQPDVQRGGRPSKSGRLRSACDTCHQSKTKCSGGLPCVTCAMSHGQCTYSVGNRLGRPKGSKNKRILLQENHISNQAGAGDGERVPRRQRQQLRQQRSMSPRSENSYDRASAEETFVDEHSEHPFGPELSSLFNALGAEDLGNALMDTSTKGLDPTAFSQVRSIRLDSSRTRFQT